MPRVVFSAIRNAYVCLETDPAATDPSTHRVQEVSTPGGHRRLKEAMDVYPAGYHVALLETAIVRVIASLNDIQSGWAGGSLRITCSKVSVLT